MKVILKKKPKRPIIIEGFPGFGLVGTIAAEFLIDHLKTKMIGKIWLEELPAMVAIHEGQVVEPIGIFYNEKYNIMIVHGITGITGLEWKISEVIINMARDLNAKEIISLEGIGSQEMQEGATKIFYHTSDKSKIKALESAGTKSLKEGIIMGTTGILLLKADKKLPVTSIFAETHSELPDSKAAAKVIQMLDSYLGLKVDPKPLMKQAEQFEDKLKELISKGQKMTDMQQKKRLSYVG